MFRSILSSRLAAVGLAGVIAVGVIGADGVALADGLPGTGGSSATSPAANHPRIVRGLFQDVVAKSGVSRDAFMDAFKQGKTINDVLGANAATVKAQVQADASARIAAAVTNGTITQARADKANAKLPAALDKLFSTTPKQGSHPRLAAIGKAALNTVAGVLNIDAAALKAEIKSGQTVAQIAGPKTNDVISALDAKADSAIDTAVSNGKVKAANADALKTKVHTRIAAWVNNGPKHKAD